MASIMSDMSTSTSTSAMARQSSGPAPIALFVYRRPAHTTKLLASLAANRRGAESQLYIFSDAPSCEAHAAGVADVRALVRELKGFAGMQLVERETNIGCAANIIDGIDQVLRVHDRVIVLEDDLELSPHFLDFMNRALDAYRDRNDIISISAASPPPQSLDIAEDDPRDVYLAPRSVPWGWATWGDRWQTIDWHMASYAYKRWRPAWRRRMARGGNDLLVMLADQMAGRIDSWNVRFNHAQAMAGSYSLYPRHSYVSNTGLDGSGRHCRAADRYKIELERAVAIPRLPPDITAEHRIISAVKAYHDEHPLSLWLGVIPGMRRLIRGVKRRLGVDRPLLKANH
jgi:hypothetical protein